ncbi:MAG: NADH-quinone oxidoreductase subunit L [Archangium gephyra]|uniref:Probable inorganic carbon transporter subunit DabB n=1 Tax=Archangium gephyra TaxID=48 RepID=A0A2W5TS35_9BACT|nr:MAG: NADH-quinone oxidoreductase subunit L [Archangium gephyra]
MPTSTPDSFIWASSALVPVALLVSALLPTRARPLATASVVTAWVSGAALALTAVRVLATFLAPLQPSVVLGGFVRVDLTACLMLSLVTCLGWVVARYSQRYLAGEAGLRRYERSLLTTLAGASLLVVSNHFGLLVLAWFLVSVALHQLLTFYPQRRGAIVAAHKKFILSRAADALLVVGTVLIGNAVGSFFVSDALAAAASYDRLPVEVHLGMVLIVGTVVLKSAQLPFHGWLTQVMEAPTPVSALLHAGVVNLGGYVLIQLSPMLLRATLAQGLLLAFGLATVVIGALTMMTRVSVKVALAWSTIAQMGFMLVQCALGAWEFAVLHLLAHSAYKAHAFLSAGTTVQTWLELGPPSRRTAGNTGVAVAVLLGLWGVVMAVTRLLRPGLFTAEWAVTTAVLAMGVSPSAALAWSWGRATALRALAPVFGVSSVLVALHWVLGPREPHGPEFTFGWGAALVAFVGLFALQASLQARPQSAVARWLRPRLFNGFSLDEWFTRLTFALWPPHDPAVGARTSRNDQAEVRS